MDENIEELMTLLWGKSEYRVKDSRRWLPLRTHLRDTCDVGEVVWTKLMCRQNRRAVCRAGNMSLEQALRIFRFLCGVHDVGKASTSFVHKSEWLHERIKSAHTILGDCRADSTVARHETVSHVALYWWMVTRLRNFGVGIDSDRKTGRDIRRRLAAWGVPVGAHHGRSPVNGSTRFITDIEAERVYPQGRIPQWKEVRNAFIDDIAQRCGITDEDIYHMAENPLRDYGQHLLSAAVIVADWIASNEGLFGYGDDESSVVDSSPTRTRHGIEKFGALDVWAPTDHMENDFAATFSKRFRKPRSESDHNSAPFKPRPVQRAVHAHVKAHAPEDGGMFILIEDTTGSGKTEAGLVAAEMLAARSGARGVMMALPTMATSNAMFDRVQLWLSRLEQEGRFSTNLLHSSAALNDKFTELQRMGMNGYTNALHCDKSLFVVHSWMVGRDRAMMSDFNVGTLDSVISAGLKREHALLPHLGISSKVLIIDEVHDSDERMREFLFRTLSWLGRYGVPVVALSATLTPSVRSKLHAAYTGITDETALAPLDTIAYPLISSSAVGGEISVTDNVIAVERTKTIILTTDPDSGKDPLVRHTLARLDDSGCAAVVCDTVRTAQSVYADLKKSLPGWGVRLIHARLTLSDRLSAENDLIKLLGENGDRPERLVVVGTQVLEQSLDIDFDVMISEIAPMDRLIQRAGRLHRHDRDNRSPAHTEPVMVITGVPADVEEPPRIGGLESQVYGTARLIMAAVVLNGRKYITTPDDTTSIVSEMSAMVETIPAEWKHNFIEAVNRDTAESRRIVENARNMLIPEVNLKSMSPIDGWGIPLDSKTEASVRNSVMDRNAVILVRSANGDLVFPENRAVVVIKKGNSDLKDFPDRDVREVALLEVRLPKDLNEMVLASIDDLEKAGYTARWDTRRSRYVDSHTLVLILDEHMETTGGGMSVKYDHEQGLTWNRLDALST
jgi:CRISPR-associated helicase Cas3/CRISPR-associated endonuclease Cas3-HD